MAGAPLGNKNAAKKRLPWQQALKRSLTRLSAKEGDEGPRYRKGLDRIADQVVKQALDGNKDAWMEIANRVEGKPGQSIEITGDPKKPIGILPWEFVNAEQPEDTE
jgi:hypothetical protein